MNRTITGLTVTTSIYVPIVKVVVKRTCGGFTVTGGCRMIEPIYMYDLGHDAPVLVDEWDGKLLIELRAYSMDGGRHGCLYHLLPREEAVKMAHAILEWTNGKG